MAKVIRLLKTIRNNLKKTTFAVLVLTYGAKYVHMKHRNHMLIKSYCEEAQAYGDVSISVGVPIRRITVVLNPASNGGKGKNEFEKYCAPLLYLSGMKVSVVKTESIGEARGLMEVIENCDGIVVAGGDGAVCEAVTGLLRRPDSELAAQKFPLGIIPIGKSNSIAKSIFMECKDDRVKLMAEATLAIIRNFQHPLDVMKVEIIDPENTKTSNKPVYAVGGLLWGAFRDVEERVAKYWIWGPLSSYVAYVSGLFNDLTWNCTSQFRYTTPCSGCRNCMMQQNISKPEVAPPPQTRWWQAFVPRSLSAKGTNLVKDYASIINEDCGVWRERDFSAVEFQAISENNVIFTKPNQPRHLEALFGPPRISAFEFIKEGWARSRNTTGMQRDKIKVRQFEMIPEQEDKSTSQGEISENQKPHIGKWFWIDGDNYELKPIRVTILPEAVRVFGVSTSR